jgi:hypothetical protein
MILISAHIRRKKTYLQYPMFREIEEGKHDAYYSPHGILKNSTYYVYYWMLQETKKEK